MLAPVEPAETCPSNKLPASAADESPIESTFPLAIVDVTDREPGLARKLPGFTVVLDNARMPPAITAEGARKPLPTVAKPVPSTYNSKSSAVSRFAYHHSSLTQIKYRLAIIAH